MGGIGGIGGEIVAWIFMSLNLQRQSGFDKVGVLNFKQHKEKRVVRLFLNRL